MKTGAISILVLVLASLGLRAQTDSKASAPAPKAAENSVQSSDATSSVGSNNTNDQRWHLRLGTVAIGAGYFYGRPFYPYGPYFPFYSQAFWDPFWGPLWDPYYPSLPLNLGYGDGKGEVRLTGAPKGAKIYVDGAYAGTADRLKHIWLDPGAYNLAVNVLGRETFRERIYILSGKVLKVAADQAPNVSER